MSISMIIYYHIFVTVVYEVVALLSNVAYD